jgi:hypothetical protein
MAPPNIILLYKELQQCERLFRQSMKTMKTILFRFLRHGLPSSLAVVLLDKVIQLVSSGCKMGVLCLIGFDNYHDHSHGRRIFLVIRWHLLVGVHPQSRRTLISASKVFHYFKVGLVCSVYMTYPMGAKAWKNLLAVHVKHRTIASKFIISTAKENLSYA